MRTKRLKKTENVFCKCVLELNFAIINNSLGEPSFYKRCNLLYMFYLLHRPCTGKDSLVFGSPFLHTVLQHTRNMQNTLRVIGVLANQYDKTRYFSKYCIMATSLLDSCWGLSSTTKSCAWAVETGDQMSVSSPPFGIRRAGRRSVP